MTRPHADQRNPVVELVGRTLDAADAELLADLDKSLRWARSLISSMAADTSLFRYRGSTIGLYRDEIELFVEDEAANSELCWMWEGEDE